MRMQTLIVGLAAFAVLGGCRAKVAERRDVEKIVNEAWRECILVEPKNVKIESQDRKTVRYTYVLKMRGPGRLAGKGYPCTEAKQKMVEMLFNKDLADLEAGAETTVTQEAGKY